MSCTSANTSRKNDQLVTVDPASYEETEAIVTNHASLTNRDVVACYADGNRSHLACSAAMMSTLLSVLNQKEQPPVIVDPKRSSVPKSTSSATRETTHSMSSNLPPTMANAPTRQAAQLTFDPEIERLLEFHSSAPSYLQSHGVVDEQREVSVKLSKTMKRTNRGELVRVSKSKVTDASILAQEIAQVHDRDVATGMAQRHLLRPERMLRGLHNVTDEQLDHLSENPFVRHAMQQACESRAPALVDGGQLNRVYNAQEAAEAVRNVVPTDEQVQERMKEIQLTNEQRSKWFMAGQKIGLLDNLDPNNEKFGVDNRGQFYVDTTGAPLHPMQDGLSTSGFNPVPTSKRKTFTRAVIEDEEAVEMMAESINKRMERNAQVHAHENKRPLPRVPHDSPNLPQEDNETIDVPEDFVQDTSLPVTNVQLVDDLDQLHIQDAFNPVERQINEEHAKFGCSTRTFVANLMHSRIGSLAAHEEMFPNGMLLQHVVPVHRQVIEDYLRPADELNGETSCCAGLDCEGLKLNLAKRFILRVADFIPCAHAVKMPTVSMDALVPQYEEAQRIMKSTGVHPRNLQCILCYVNQVNMLLNMVDAGSTSLPIDLFLSSIFVLVNQVGQFVLQDCRFPSSQKYNGLAGPIFVHHYEAYRPVTRIVNGREMDALEMRHASPRFDTNVGFHKGPGKF